LVLKSYAKLNLYLDILGKRRDNYHNLDTLFERIDLSDSITLRARRDNLIRIICKNKDVPVDKSNLCYRAAALIRQKRGIKKGVDIKIDKNIPVGAGLGGGSSNAATVLLGLNRLWKLRLSRNALCGLAAKIGSDVPFFIHNVSFARGCGRGERIEPIRGLKHLKLWHILVAPKLQVSTPFIYRKWDKFTQKNKKARLTSHPRNVKIVTSLLKERNLADLTGCLYNGLEQVTFSLYPQLRRVREALKKSGIGVVLMSGSGPAIFGIATSRKEAVRVRGQLDTCDSPWRIFLTRTA